MDAGALLLSLKTGESASTKKIFGSFSSDTKEVIGGLVALERVGLLEKTVKNFCCWPMARLLGNPLPAQKEGTDYTYLFGRRVRRFIISRISQGAQGKCPRRKQLKFAESILKLKDATVPVSKNFIDGSARDYEESLSATPPSPDDQLCSWLKGWDEGQGGSVEEEGGQTPHGFWRERVLQRLREEGLEWHESRLRKAIQLTVNEAIKPVSPHAFRDDEVTPSISSCYERGRREGGAAQELVERSYQNGLVPTELLFILYHPQSGLKHFYGKPVELSGCYIPAGTRARARTASVLEACKVRWVSIGEAEPYYRAKAWNRLVYQQMPKHPTFELMCRPLGVDDVDRMKGKYLLSGDYKGATDTLDPEWSEYTFECITRRLYAHATDDNSLGGHWVRRYLGLVPMLTRHHLEHNESEFDQETGQLMGSYLSFPVLCILNAAVNRLYLDPSLESPVADLPLMVNGDDVMMSSDTDFEDWASHISTVGLKPSLGKNYVHTHVCCLNSEFYIRDSSDAQFERSYPWRLNLAFGRWRSVGDGGTFGKSTTRTNYKGQFSGLGAMARTLTEHHEEKEADLLLSAFIRNNIDVLKRTSRSWWTPEQLGGLGLPLTRRTYDQISPTGLAVATYLLTRPEPEDVLIYAPRNATETTLANAKWTQACTQAYKSLGYSYHWLPADEETPPPLPAFRDYLGYGTYPDDSMSHDRYRTVVALAKKAMNHLTPVSYETLLDFCQTPRKAGWTRRA